MLSRQAAGGFGMRDRETTVGGYRRPIRRYRFLKIKTKNNKSGKWVIKGYKEITADKSLVK